jgi:hypothetical protein
MALSGAIKPGRNREKATTSGQIIRHRREGTAIVDHTIHAEPDPLSLNTELDNHSYVDLEHNDEGAVTTDPNTIPRP